MIQHVVTKIVLFVLVAASVFSAQAQEDIFETRFYSTSITSSDESRLQQVIFYDTEDNLIVQSSPLLDVISRAYKINPYRIVDGPDWLYTPYLYDIKAVPPPVFIQSDKEQMLLNLLADRFKLLAESTTRVLSGRALVLDGNEQPFDLLTVEPVSGIKLRRFVSDAGKQDLRLELSFDTLADSLSRELDQPVLNLTGLAGTYVIELNGAPSDGYSPRFEPLLELMGLRLEDREMPVEVLAITHIEPPEIDNR